MFSRHPLLAVVTNHLVYYPTPLNVTYFWGFGSLAGLLLASQMLTGIFLAMHYSPHVDLAFASLEHIMRDVNHGWLIRYLHANGASFFFAAVYIHIGRTLYFGFYQRTRALLWFSGIVIFFLMMATGFMGYVLPWGQMSFWGATVITNLFTAIPLIGESLATWLWGGFSVSNATLVRFFSLHYLLPFVIVGVIGLHLVLLHRDGSYNPLGVIGVPDKVAFYPYFYVKDYFGFIFFSTLGIFVVMFYPDFLGHPDNYIEANALVTPPHIVPEWYFLPFYAILRAVPNKLGGVVLMVLAILALAVLPVYETRVRSLLVNGRLLYSWFFWTFAFSVIFLGHFGGLPIEDPYPFASQVLALVYFSFFFVFVVVDYLMTSTFYTTSMLTRSGNVPHSHQLFQGFFLAGMPATNRTSLFWSLTSLSRWNQKVRRVQRAYSVKLLKTLNQFRYSLQTYKHPFHLVNVSPWPFFVALSLLAVTVGSVLYFHRYMVAETTLLYGFSALLFVCICWFRDIVREATFEGHHTLLVQRGIKLGMILFIVSEVMFFFSFFWAFFHSSLAPAIQIGGIWPPRGITVFNPWEVPLLNTLILLTSGASVTWAHYAVRSRFVRWFSGDYWRCFDRMHRDYRHKSLRYSRKCLRTTVLGVIPRFMRSLLKVNTWLYSRALSRVNGLLLTSSDFYGGKSFLKIREFLGPMRPVWLTFRSLYASFFERSRHDLLLALLVTVVLGVLFTLIQFYEYKHAPFTISDSVYGSTFFLTTGFHGLHVLVGTIFLVVCFIRGYRYHFTRGHHVGLECAIWYWHFVDVVWLGLYISVYHWGGSI